MVFMVFSAGDEFHTNLINDLGCIQETLHVLPQKQKPSVKRKAESMLRRSSLGALMEKVVHSVFSDKAALKSAGKLLRAKQEKKRFENQQMCCCYVFGHYDSWNGKENMGDTKKRMTPDNMDLCEEELEQQNKKKRVSFHNTVDVRQIPAPEPRHRLVIRGGRFQFEEINRDVPDFLREWRSTMPLKQIEKTITFRDYDMHHGPPSFPDSAFECAAKSAASATKPKRVRKNSKNSKDSNKQTAVEAEPKPSGVYQDCTNGTVYHYSEDHRRSPVSGMPFYHPTLKKPVFVTSDGSFVDKKP